MPAEEHVPRSQKKAPCSIAKVEANNSVESYVSASNSSTRLRLSTSATSLSNADKDNTLPPTSMLTRLRYPGVRGLFQGTWGSDMLCDSQGDLLATYPSGYSARHSTRHERSWIAGPLKHGFLTYCLFSCLFVLSRLYSNGYVMPLMSAFGVGFSGLPSGTEAALSVGPYLTAAYGNRMTHLEPFILRSKTQARITVCAWLHESELSHVNSWIKNWNGSVSLLVTSAALPGTSQHAELLGTIRSMSRQWSLSRTAGVSLHLLHVQSHESHSPNSFLNLAKLYAESEWVLLYPGKIRGEFPNGLRDAAYSVDLTSKTDLRVLNSASPAYPFSPLAPLILSSSYDFWCMEKMLAPLTRSSDWNECLWQVSLETLGKVAVTGQAILMKTGNTITEGSTTRRINTRLRAEKCDNFLRQLTIIQPRGRYKEAALDWVRGFCLKTVDNKKLNR